MTLAAWLYVKPAAWDAIAPGEGAAPQLWHYPYRNARWGVGNDPYWNAFPGGFRVYSTVGNQAQLEDLAAQFAPADIARKFAWLQGKTFDSLDFWPTDPADILAVMKGGATYENPNWNLLFAGQPTQIFAGDHNSDFNEDYL